MKQIPEGIQEKVLMAFVKGQLASAEAKDVKFGIDSNARDI